MLHPQNRRAVCDSFAFHWHTFFFLPHNPITVSKGLERAFAPANHQNGTRPETLEKVWFLNSVCQVLHRRPQRNQWKCNEKETTTTNVPLLCLITLRRWNRYFWDYVTPPQQFERDKVTEQQQWLLLRNSNVQNFHKQDPGLYRRETSFLFESTQIRGVSREAWVTNNNRINVY